MARTKAKRSTGKKAPSRSVPRSARARAGTSRGGATPTAAITKVAFTLFPVEDPRRARAFYEKALGLRRGLASRDGVWTEYDLPGGGCVALFRHPDPDQAPPPGGASVALEVVDLDALSRRLRRRGVVFRGDVVHGPSCRMASILDSEGNALILHESAR